MPAFIGQLVNLLHVSVVIMALSLAFVIFDASLFSWHPVMMSIGYVIFMAEGLIASVMFRHLEGPERVRAIQSHALMQLRALLCIAIGFGVIYRNKVMLPWLTNPGRQRWVCAAGGLLKQYPCSC